ncbi:MAG: alpha-galactosidase [Anaerolineaceae bacterium]|nr:alpha-galactosidase [Anaerolineaceae bacterium]
MNTLANSSINFSVDPHSKTFSLFSSTFNNAKLEKATFDLELLTDNGKAEFSFTSQEQTENSISLTYHDRFQSLELTVVFSLLPEKDFLFQKMSLKNHGDETVTVKRFFFSRLQAGKLHFSENQAVQTAFYSNGWQSWSPSGSWQAGQKQIRSRLKPFAHPMIYNPGTPLSKAESEFSSDMFAAILDHQARVGLIVGFLSQKEQFGSIVSTLHPEPDLQIWANCDDLQLLPGKQLQSDTSVWQFFDTLNPEPFKAYFEAVSAENQVSQRMKTTVGWCSWYYYFQKISPEIIRTNLRAVQKTQDQFPLDVFQIDDGFEQDVGTWDKFQNNFPDGLKPLSQEIQKAGYQAGVWLAPFIVQRNSELVKTHPEWLLKTKKGQRANSGFVWNNLGYALDLTIPEVEDFIRQTIRRAVSDWEFPYLKLDFLYAAALDCDYSNPIFTRAQVLRKGLEIIRDEAGEEAILLGCGVPIGSGIGIFDMLRISADVSPDWAPKFLGLKSIFRNEPNMPSAKNAIQNILSRSIMEPHLWVNDPDCLLVREDSNLSLPEVQSLATAISITGGAVLISDDMSKLSADRLKLAASLLPVLPAKPHVRDLFSQNMPSQISQDLQNAQGDWKLIALFNWQDQAVDLKLSLKDWGIDEQEMLMREFWSSEIARFNQSHTFKNVEAHGVRLVALRQLRPLTYLGSDLHLAQGVELKRWQLTDSSLEIGLDLERKTEGTVYLWSEKEPRSVEQNGENTHWQWKNNIITLKVSLDPTSTISIKF